MKEFQTTIEATTEVALQRAMFILGSSKRGLKDDEIEWLDMEIPVVPGNARRLDLIGRYKKSKEFVICELKYGNSLKRSNSPQYAADEVVRYYELIKRNYAFVKNKHHYVPNEDQYVGKVFDWKDVISRNTKLIVVANAAYWAYWLGHLGKELPKSGVFEGITRKIECYSIDIPIDYFEKQSIGESKYQPYIDNCILEVL